MPILAAEPDLFPDGLLSADAPLCSGRAWWVAHTRPRQEKSLARQLHADGAPFFLPLVRRQLRLRERVLTSYVPLFPGYVFLLASREERLGALSVARVVRRLPVGDQDALWHDLRQIHRLVSSGAAVTPEDRRGPGRVVKICSGPLAGLRGKIIEAASRRRFVVEVDFIQRGASVLLDDFVLAPAGP